MFVTTVRTSPAPRRIGTAVTVGIVTVGVVTVGIVTVGIVTVGAALVPGRARHPSPAQPRQCGGDGVGGVGGLEWHEDNLHAT